MTINASIIIEIDLHEIDNSDNYEFINNESNNEDNNKDEYNEDE